MKGVFKIVAILLMVFAIDCELQKERIRIYDQNNYHYVMGGSSAINHGRYQYYQLKQTMEQIIGKKDYRVFSISLLDQYPSRETKDRFVQQNFYNKSPGRPNEALTDHVPSYYFNFGVSGTLLNPNSLPQFFRKRLIKYYKLIVWDNLQGIFDTIQREMSYILYSNIYVHSYEGLHRVSYVMGAYKMKYKNESLTNTLKQISKFHKQQRAQPLEQKFVNGLRWYCLFLKRSNDQCLGENLQKNKQQL